MSRPRKPYGATHRGRLPATMIKVLAAEMSDPHRLRRGKQYARDGSVLDIEIEPGVVTCEVQGSRSTPYIAAIEVTQGDGMPLRRDVTTRCTCPDDDNWDDHSCKHALAAMFAFSDELLIEPELLDVWRNRPATESAGPERVADDDRPSRRHLRLVDAPDERAGGATPRGVEPDVPIVDPLEADLAVPAGTELPVVPDLDPLDPPPPRESQLAAVLRDALAAARVDWD